MAFEKVFVYSHFHALDLDSPGIGGLVEGLLHHVRNGLALAQNLGQVLRSQHIPERCRRQKVGRVAEMSKLSMSNYYYLIEDKGEKTGLINYGMQSLDH